MIRLLILYLIVRLLKKLKAMNLDEEKYEYYK